MRECNHTDGCMAGKLWVCRKCEEVIPPQALVAVVRRLEDEVVRLRSFPHGRGSGRTTRQIIEAPKGALFIVGNEAMRAEVRRMAHQHDRCDLRIETLSWVAQDRWRGLKFTSVVFDHSITPAQMDGYSVRALLWNAEHNRNWSKVERLFSGATHDFECFDEMAEISPSAWATLLAKGGKNAKA